MHIPQVTSIRQSKPADLAGPYTQFLSQFLVKPALGTRNQRSGTIMTSNQLFRLGSMQCHMKNIRHANS